MNKAQNIWEEGKTVSSPCALFAAQEDFSID